MDAVAFALRAEYEGTETIEVDGSTETVPKFGGGVLAIGNSDFHVADELAAGDGTIVVHAGDQQLIDVLSVYPALKAVPVPDKAKPVSQYARQPLDDLRQTASLRDIHGAASLSKAKLVKALEAHDRQLAQGNQAAAAAVADDPGDATEGDAETDDSTGSEG